MMNNPETINDIIREMRVLAKSHCSEDGMDWTDALELIPIDEFADRIESAWNRENAEIEEDALNTCELIKAFRRHESIECIMREMREWVDRIGTHHIYRSRWTMSCVT